MRVGVVGTGAMGEAMVRRLLAAGLHVQVYNRTAARTAPLVAAGAVAADTPAEAVRDRDVVITMLTDADAVRSVLSGGAGFASALAPGMTFVDMGTSGPDLARKLPALVPQGVGVLDAPVMGSREQAEAGQLEILVGGDAADVARAAPVLDALGTYEHVGPSGSGAAAKLVANFALLGTLSLLREVVGLGSALGLESDALFKALEVSPLGEQAARRRAALEGEPSPPRFGLSLAHKDARLVSDAARALGLAAAHAAATRTTFAEADRSGLRDADYTAALGGALPGTART